MIIWLRETKRNSFHAKKIGKPARFGLPIFFAVFSISEILFPAAVKKRFARLTKSDFFCIIERIGGDRA